MILIGVNVAVFLAVLLTGGGYARLATALSITPLGQCLVDDASGSYYPGVLDPATCASQPGAYWAAGVAYGAFWQVLTSAFTHAEILHIGANMLALFFLGPPLEQVLGRTRFLAVYLISALAGSAAVMWLAPPDSSALGASGAIFGMLGALPVITRKAGGNYQLVLAGSASTWCSPWWAARASPGRATWVACSAGWPPRRFWCCRRRHHRRRWQWPGLAALTGLLLAVIVARVIMLR